MIILDATLYTLKREGISIKWYHDADFCAFHDRIWHELYQQAFDYYKDHVRGCDAVMQGRCNEVFKSVKELEEYSTKSANREIDRATSPRDYETLYVTHDGNQMLVRKVTRSKEITLDYIHGLVERNRKLYSGTYGQFAIKMQNLCEEKGFTNHFCIYPTTYGIGVWLFYNFNADEHVKKVEAIMKEKGIEYYNEFSEARWVYRFKVSKKAANITRI